MAGKEEVMKTMAEMNLLHKKQRCLKSGILSLDIFVSGENTISETNGFICGKFVSISGPNGVGKSTLCMELSKRFCKQGLKAVYCDYESGLNEKSLNDFGLTEYAAFDRENPRKAIANFVDGIKPLLIIDPETFNKTALIWNQMLEDLKCKIDVGIFDSLKTIKTTYSQENIDSLEQLPIGLNARSQEAFLPFMKSLFNKHDILGLFVQQFRTQINQWGGFQSEPTNNSFLYNMDERIVMTATKKGEIMIKVINSLGEKIDKKIGAWVDLKLTKSRVGNGFSILPLPIIYGKGVSTITLYTTLLVNAKIFTPGPYADSRSDLKPLKAILSPYGDVTTMPDEINRGLTGIHEVIKNYIEIVEKYILENNMLVIERPYV